MRAGLTITVLVALLIASAAVAFRVWRELGDVEISGHGWLALSLGATATILVGAGLMALVFFSSRRGYDERVNRPDDGHRDER
ncbi:MAG: hypothetical protein ACR2QF_09975 [Geminicoccaceae bacterium]